MTRAKEPSLLPRYAPPEDVDRVLTQLHGPMRVAAIIMYGSGTRISETLSLRVKDLDLTHREVTVRWGKGAKDRTTVIPEGAIPALREQMERVAEEHDQDLVAGHGWAPLPGALHRKDPGAGWELAWQYLFPAATLSRDPKTGSVGRRHAHPTTFQRALKTAVHRSGVTRPISAHVLRHCFATEMVRSGCDIRMLQRLLGHSDVRTTMRYLHVLDRPGLNIQSPYDRLPSQRGGPASRRGERSPEESVPASTDREVSAQTVPQPNRLSRQDGDS